MAESEMAEGNRGNLCGDHKAESQPCALISYGVKGGSFAWHIWHFCVRCQGRAGKLIRLNSSQNVRHKGEVKSSFQSARLRVLILSLGSVGFIARIYHM